MKRQSRNGPRPRWTKCSKKPPKELETVLLTVHEEESARKKRNGEVNLIPESTFVTLGYYYIDNSGNKFWIYANRTVSGSNSCLCKDGWQSDDGDAQIISWRPCPKPDVLPDEEGGNKDAEEADV